MTNAQVNNNRLIKVGIDALAPLLGGIAVPLADPATEVELPTDVPVVLADTLMPTILSMLDVVAASLTGGKLEPRASVVSTGFALLVAAVAYGAIVGANDQIAHI